MCTYLTLTTPVVASAQRADGWLAVTDAVVSFDHPQHVAVEHALCIDFRVAGGRADEHATVELDAASARALAAAILQALDDPESLALQ